eukprot:Nk52_evm28s147 gene=Nk52_evmTU28s147
MTDLSLKLNLTPAEQHAYQQLFSIADVNGKGQVMGGDAVPFFQKSKLDITVLQKIWTLADNQEAGFLDKKSFFVALKCISLFQMGENFDAGRFGKESPIPTFEGIQIKQQQVPSSSSATSSPVKAPGAAGPFDWKINKEQKSKYENHYSSLNPVNGMIGADAARNFLMESKLPVTSLMKIWELSDMDQDGQLNKEEFFIAMHLTFAGLRGQDIASLPNSAPKDLIVSAKEATQEDLPPLPPMPAQPSLASLGNTGSLVSQGSFLGSPTSHSPGGAGWIVSNEEKSRYDVFFNNADSDKDGLVTGAEAREVFIGSKLPAGILGHIWNLVDIGGTGQLNSEQFALAMMLINKKLKDGVDPPAALAPNMVPPTLRSQTQSPFPGGASPLTGSMASGMDKVTEKVLENPQVKAQTESLNIANKALDDLAKEIEVLRVEREEKERETMDKESLAEQRRKEVATLSAQLETFKADFEELNKHKGNTEERLEVLNKQKKEYEESLTKVKTELEEEKAMVETIRERLQEEEAVVKAQEEELANSKAELESAQHEKQKLESDLSQTIREIESIGKQLTLVESETKRTRTQIQEQMSKNKIANIDLINHRAAAERADHSSEVSANPPGEAAPSAVNGHVEGGVASQSASVNETAAARRRSSENPFANDAFNAPVPVKSDDPFRTAADPFSSANDPFKAGSATAMATNSDPFAKANDPFASTAAPPSEASSQFAFGASASDPFASSSAAPASANAFPSDAFANGADPFASTSGNNDSSGAFQSSLSKDPFAPKADPFSVKPFEGSNSGNDTFEGKSVGNDPWADMEAFGQAEAALEEDKMTPRQPPEGMNEEEQVAWAIQESERVEKVKKARQLKAEEEDLKLAMQASLQN